MKFSDKVYKIVKKIPKGKVTTYKKIGLTLNSHAYQAIGQILAKNPYGFLDYGNVPCHRVISSNGFIGGFCGNKFGEKINLKKKLLRKEGIKFDFENHLYNFK